jgi:uncharacterized protein (DUF934 family)
MALYHDGRFVADAWRFPGDDEPLPASGDIAVPKARFMAEREALRARASRLGVILTGGDTIAGIDIDLPRLSLIVLRFARFADGRPYSLARQLRDHWGYRGELRAAGEVLRDQIALLQRAGFDALEITHAGTLAALHERGVVAVEHYYQPASNEDEETRVVGPVWRRRPRRILAPG